MNSPAPLCGNSDYHTIRIRNITSQSTGSAIANWRMAQEMASVKMNYCNAAQDFIPIHSRGFDTLHENPNGGIVAIARCPLAVGFPVGFARSPEL